MTLLSLSSYFSFLSKCKCPKCSLVVVSVSFSIARSRIKTCSTQPHPWILLDLVHWYHTFGVVPRRFLDRCVYEMPKSIPKDLAFLHIWSILWIHVQGVHNSTHSHFISICYIFCSWLITLFICSYIFVFQLLFTCNVRFPLLEMLLSSYIMRNSLRGMNVLQSSSTNIWWRQWIKSRTLLCILQ